MKLSTAVRSSVTLIVVMLAILVVALAVTGANVGPIEIFVWLGILAVGLVLIAAGSRRSSSTS